MWCNVRLSRPMNLEIALLLSSSNKAVTISDGNLFVYERDKQRGVAFLNLVRGNAEEIEAHAQSIRDGSPSFIDDWNLDLDATIWHPLEMLSQILGGKELA